MRKIKRLCGLFICCCVVVTSSVTAFAAEKVKEPFANLEVVTDKETINEIVSENPRIQKYLPILKLSQIRMRLKKSGKKIQM